MQSDTLKYLLEYVWIPIVTALVTMWVKFTGLETRAQILERADKQHIKQRDEDRTIMENQRNEMLAKVDRHHESVMKKLDTLENRIKNGR